jgi:hypothetical protein
LRAPATKNSAKLIPNQPAFQPASKVPRNQLPVYAATSALRFLRRFQGTRAIRERPALAFVARQRSNDRRSSFETLRGRATFYAHFDNKQDLLASGIDGLRASLKERQRQALSQGAVTDERLFAFSHEMFVHANEHRDVFRAMLGKRSGAVIQQLFHKMLVDLVRDDLKAMASRSGTGSLPSEAAVQFLAGGLLGLVIWWVDGKMRLSVDDVNALFVGWPLQR